MKCLRIVLFGFLSLGLICSAIFAQGHSAGGVFVDKVEGVFQNDTIAVGTTLRFVLRFRNDSTNSWNISNGFRLFSTDGAVWDSTTGDSLGWRLGDPSPGVAILGGAQFDLSLGINKFSCDGIGSDTVGILGINFSGTGLRRGFDDTAFSITVFNIHQESVGRHICIDSSWFRPGGTWKWAGKLGTHGYPTWSGKRCFVVVDVFGLTVEGEVATNVVSHAPKLTWKRLIDTLNVQDSFQIAVGTNDDWSIAEMWALPPVSSSDTSVIYAGAPLEDGKDYFFRIRVHNVNGWSVWSASKFRMNSIPTTPAKIRPIANAVANTSTPTLWVQNATDAEGDLLTYEFNGFHDTDCVAGPPIVLTGVASGTDSTGGQIITPLSENCRYWWMARAYDGHEYGSWSQLSTFYVNGTQEPPIAFALKSPVDSGLWPEFNMLPMCTWNQSFDPDPFDTVLYKLELSDRANFSFEYAKDSLPLPQFTLTDSLYFGTRYYWRVTAQDRTGLKTVTPVRDFWTWKPGDADHSHSVDISDLMVVVDYLILGIPISLPFVADFNGDCILDISDIMYMVDYLTGTGPEAKATCTP